MSEDRAELVAFVERIAGWRTSEEVSGSDDDVSATEAVEALDLAISEARTILGR